MISSFRSLGEGTVPSSRGGSYSFDHGDLTYDRYHEHAESRVIWRQRVSSQSAYATRIAEELDKDKHAPIAFPIPVIVACQVLFARRAIRHHLQWLVDAAQKVVRVVRAHRHERCDVLLHMRGRETSHEVKHRVYKVAHDCWV